MSQGEASLTAMFFFGLSCCLSLKREERLLNLRVLLTQSCLLCSVQFSSANQIQMCFLCLAWAYNFENYYDSSFKLIILAATPNEFQIIVLHWYFLFYNSTYSCTKEKSLIRIERPQAHHVMDLVKGTSSILKSV